MSLYKYDRDFLKDSKFRFVIGLDEAGRGPLAGPVVTAAVILDLENPIDGIDDSKKLTEKNRRELFKIIKEKAVYVQATAADPHLIAKLNIYQATIHCLQRCCLKWINNRDVFFFIDGNIVLPNIAVDRQKFIVKGDGKSASVAAASIVAKVSRDQIMRGYAKQYPEYLFEKHKGYGTAQHIALIAKHGMTPIHRTAFCKNALKKAFKKAT